MTNMTIYDDEITQGSHQFKIDTKEYVSGVYFIRIEEPDKVITEKIIINK
jgi:hypothetical protein